MNSIIENIIKNMEKVIVGKRDVLEKIVIALLNDGHVLIEDVPGVGKTKTVATLAKTLDGDFNRIQFTPDVMPSDVVGFSMYNPSNGSFEYRKGAAMCNFLLADEINRASSKTQSSLLEAMEEAQVTVDGVTYKLPKPFMVLATQNPIESYGTYILPEAQMDRFFLRLSIGYPNKSEEKRILDRFESENPLTTLNKVITKEDVIKLQNEVKEVKVSDSIKMYILDIVEATRKAKEITLGVSPRGSLSLLRAAKALAFIRGRDFVLPDDVQEMAVPVLAHRIIVNSNIKSQSMSQEDIIKQVLKIVEVPIFQI
ncbi:MoxR-like ATPase [Clostridium cavendishii DSM 21758]|uniref:MoxR-like ATPase n=1 Tax=Clostridium cavendishii DSM 21758 TaxID=1121302 RepID=A0A1M6I6G8_9CLOT|nr:MoxR family ATPase [Clostridium cavendishii]SHJ30021.1 MoxR-like ATPase [Clostridium cavendishii DSM 21758]